MNIITSSSGGGGEISTYTLAKLRKSLEDFDTSEEPMPMPLVRAYHQLSLLGESDFPIQLRADFRALLKSMTCLRDPVAPGCKGRIGDARHTIGGMDIPDCLHVVAMIAALIKELERADGKPA